eukprot:gene6872-9526_t
MLKANVNLMKTVNVTAGTFRKSSLEKHCKPHSTCTQNEYTTQLPTISTDRKCSDTTHCKINQWEWRVPTETSDRECRECSTCGDGRTVAKGCSEF